MRRKDNLFYSMGTQHEMKHLRALVSVYDKEAARRLIGLLHDLGVEMIASGGTLSFIRSLGAEATGVDELTAYPSILGGRVKTMHPSIMGGILCRPSLPADQRDMERFGFSAIDMVVVDLYPFEESLASGAGHDEVMEQVDIGGITLMRAAAKNHDRVLIVPGVAHFEHALQLLERSGGLSTLEERKHMAALAMECSSHYDTAIYHYLSDGSLPFFKESIRDAVPLRYGENPHQDGRFYGRFGDAFEQLSGKPLSYNNLLDIDAALGLMADFSLPAFAIIKHGNVCGAATRDRLTDAWRDALAGDPVSAFGGVLITNREIGEDVAGAIHSLFFEVLLAPSYTPGALDLLQQKKNRVLLKSRNSQKRGHSFRSLRFGLLWQTDDEASVPPGQWTIPTTAKPSRGQQSDMTFANIVVKHLKSNAIAIVRDRMLLGMGAGQTSRVDALRQALDKARENKQDLQGAVMASDAFFPFPDCVEMAHRAGITAVIQPGGSKNDQASIDWCEANGMAMALTGRRHFKH